MNYKKPKKEYVFNNNIIYKKNKVASSFFNPFLLLFQANNLLRRLESDRSSQQLGMDERSQMAARLESWEKKCNELRDENAKLKSVTKNTKKKIF